MVATTVPTGMPQREFSAAIVGGSWPVIAPETYQTASEAQRAQGVKLLDAAGELHQQASGVAADQSGQAIDGFCRALRRWANEHDDTADQYFAIARASEEIGRLLYDLRDDLDQIDLHAHEAIERLLKEQERLGAAATWAQINAVVAKARAAAMAADAKTAAAIATQGEHIGIAANSSSEGSGAGTDPVDPKLRDLQKNGFGGGHSPRGGMPTGLDNVPKSPVPAEGPRPQIGGQRDGTGSRPPGGQSSLPGVTPEPTGAGGDTADPKPHRPQLGSERGLDSGGVPLAPLPFDGSSGDVPASSGGGGLGGGLPGGGLKLPETPGVLGGLGGGGGLPQGLTPTNFSPGTAGTAPLTAAPTDFGRGLGGGLSAGPAPLAAPVASPSSMPTSAAPAGAYSPGPAPVAAFGSVPAVSSSVSPPVAAPAPWGGGGVPAGPVGPLPPFGSDVPRTAVTSAGAAVSHTTGPPLAPSVPVSGSSGSAPLAPLPPGVAGPGVGASARVAAMGVRSSRPDPLLESASQLVYHLLHASQKSKYHFMDWCVGVFRTLSAVETVIVNSDGTGYIPAGVFVPRSARMLFADSSLNPAFRARWFSWANPAETMLAYAELATNNNPAVELWALAVSTEYGGSSVPARAADIPHFEDCPLDLSPISPTAPVMPLDESHMHRLETLDRALYARLTGVGDGRLPDRSEAWRTTITASEAALGRVGAMRDVSVPPVVREVIDLLSKGLTVTQERWKALERAYFETVGMGSALRPGLIANAGPASAHVVAHFDLARLLEIFLLWNLGDDTAGQDIKYPEIAYLAAQIEISPQPEFT